MESLRPADGETNAEDRRARLGTALARVVTEDAELLDRLATETCDNHGRRPGGVATVGRPDFSKLLPGTRSPSVAELAQQQGVRPVTSLDEMRADLWESDEELEEFLADVRASRQADLG
jgi:hypothetical protein